MTTIDTSECETTDFGDLEIAFDDRVLRPRSWTVAQSHWSAALLAHLPEGRVLELCSGAGQIGLQTVVGSERQLVCVDANPVAAAYTRRNADAAGMTTRVSVREGLIEESLLPGELFSLIIADPPWVPSAETGRFPEDPLLAIDGGDDGMEVAGSCIRAIDGHLSPGGAAVLQLGSTTQAGSLMALLPHSDLVAGEVREYGDRGVLVRLDRR